MLLFVYTAFYWVHGRVLPLRVTFSLLISSPMVDLGSLIMLMNIFGAKVAVVYVIVGLIVAVLGKGALLGIVLSLMVAVMSLSLPSTIMRRKAIKPRLLGLFIAISTVWFTITGYSFNIFSSLFI